MSVTLRRQGQSETVARIASNRSPEQFKRFDRLVLFPGLIEWQRTQVEIVCGQSLVGRSAERRISAACNAGSMTPATVDATSS